MAKITEAEFKECAKNNAVRSATVANTEDSFILVVELTWKEGLFTMYTFRNRHRAWASVDRILSYLERNELKLKSIVVEL